MRQGAIRPLLRAFEKISHRAVADAGFRAQFGLFDWGRVAHPDRPRLQGSLTPQPPRLFLHHRRRLNGVEIHREQRRSPAASAYNDALNSAFFGLRVMGEFLRTLLPVRTIPTRHSVMQVLLD